MKKLAHPAGFFCNLHCFRIKLKSRTLLYDRIFEKTRIDYCWYSVGNPRRVFVLSFLWMYGVVHHYIKSSEFYALRSVDGWATIEYRRRRSREVPKTKARGIITIRRHRHRRRHLRKIHHHRSLTRKRKGE